MRVCLATDSLVPSGMGVHMLTLAGALEDCEVTVVAPRETGLFAAAMKDYRVRAYEEGEAFSSWLAASAFDILHVHAGIGWEGHDLARAAVRTATPFVRTEHLPCLLTDPAQRDAYATAASAAAAIIGVSEAVASSHRDSGLLGGLIATIRNGIAKPQPHSGTNFARYERLDDRPLLLSVGRLTAQKRHSMLIEAVAILAERGVAVDLAIAGQGPDGAHLMRQVRAVGLTDRVRLMGERRDVPGLMAAADLYVHAAAFEGLPLVLLEAMAAHLPIVAIPGPGIDEALSDDTAQLAAAPDAAALADAIVHALGDRDATARRADTAAARQAASFTAERMASETRELYTQHARKDRPVDTVRIGFVGAGGIAHRHAGVLATMDDVRIAAVADDDQERARALASDHGAKVYADAEAMIAAGDIDGVFVCVPPFAHGPIEDAIVAAGLPFLVEKPVAISLKEAERIADAVDDAGLITAVGYHWRWLDTLDAVRDALGDRRPRLISGYWLDSTPPVEWWWKQDRSGGQMTEQATHVIDLARYLCGDVDLAFGLAEHTARDSYPGLDVATASTASLRFADGAVGNFAATCLLGWNHRVGLHLFGEGFAVEITDHEVMIDVGAGRPVTPNGADPVWRQDRAFVEAVMGRGNAIRCNYRNAVDSLRVVDAIARSVRSGQAVSLSPAVPAVLQERAA